MYKLPHHNQNHTSATTNPASTRQLSSGPRVSVLKVHQLSDLEDDTFDFTLMHGTRISKFLSEFKDSDQ